MNYFDTDIDISIIPKNKLQIMLEKGDSIIDPPWTIRPYKFQEEDFFLVKELLDTLPIKPAYIALIMTPKNTICKTHVDNIGGRNCAINLPLQVDDSLSLFEYMQDDNVIEQITCSPIKCWRVDIPHRVNNLNYNKNRVTLSLGFTQSINELYSEFKK